MSLGEGSDKEGAVSSRRVLRVTGEDAVGSSDAERFREDADVDDSIESDLYRFLPSAVDKRVECEGAEELDIARRCLLSPSTTFGLSGRPSSLFPRSPQLRPLSRDGCTESVFLFALQTNLTFYHQSSTS